MFRSFPHQCITRSCWLMRKPVQTAIAGNLKLIQKQRSPQRSKRNVINGLHKDTFSSVHMTRVLPRRLRQTADVTQAPRQVLTVQCLFSPNAYNEQSFVCFRSSPVRFTPFKLVFQPIESASQVCPPSPLQLFRPPPSPIRYPQPVSWLHMRGNRYGCLNDYSNRPRFK